MRRPFFKAHEPEKQKGRASPTFPNPLAETCQYIRGQAFERINFDFPARQAKPANALEDRMRQND